MRSANHAHIAGSILVAEYLGISSASVLRKVSVSRSFPAKPMIANCLESRLSAARLHSAGINFRFVRSPVAPNITITQGEATGFGFEWFMRILWSGFLFRVAAELKTHRRQKLRGKLPFAARREALVERFAQDRSLCARLDCGDKRLGTV